MTTIRNATLQDIPEVVVLGKRFAKMSGYGFKFEVEKFTETLKAVIANPTMTLIVAEKDDEIVGFIYGVLSAPVWAGNYGLVELAWFVDPSHRDYRTGLKLLRTFEEFGKRNGASHIAVSDFETIQSLGKLYERNGYTLTEKTYLKEL